MALTSGTYTFGNGGTYANLTAMLNAVFSGSGATLSLTGDLTLILIGDSLEPGVNIAVSSYALYTGYFKFSIIGNTPHYGSTLNGHKIQAHSLGLPQTYGVGPVIFNDIYLDLTLSLFFFSTQQSYITLKLDILNCIFKLLQFYKYAMVTPFIGAESKISMINTKFIGNVYFDFGRATQSQGYGISYLSQFYFVENCVFKIPVGKTSSIDTCVYFETNSSNGPINPASFFKNCTFLVNVTATQKAVDGNCVLPGGQFINNARNGGIDSYTYSYPSISESQNLLSTDITQPGFLDLKRTSPLWSAGATPSLALNPYTAPIPIGIRYSSALSIAGGASNTLNVPVTQTVGGGITVPPGARILPQSTAKISHARILKEERTPEKAQLFFDLIKEKTS